MVEAPVRVCHMSNRNELVDGLHAVLLELWEGSDEIAATAFRKLMSWAIRTAKPDHVTYRAGTFPGPQFSESPDVDVIVASMPGLRLIETAFNANDTKAAVQNVKDLLVVLSEPPVPVTAHIAQ